MSSVSVSSAFSGRGRGVPAGRAVGAAPQATAQAPLCAGLPAGARRFPRRDAGSRRLGNCPVIFAIQMEVFGLEECREFQLLAALIF